MSINYDSPTSNKLIDRMKMNPLLTWLSDMVKIATKDEIVIPNNYRDMVIQVKKLLNTDTSGYASSVLDFAINSALVDYKVETKNKNLNNLLNNWLDNLNDTLRGEIPVGVKALAREYFRERWKGSSFLLLRSFWEEKDGFYLPTVLYFVDGEDIIVEGDKESKNLNGRKYKLRINKDKTKSIGVAENEELFIQKPYTSWGNDYSVPYIIQRGLFRNLKFLELLEKKGEFVVGKALEYLGVLRKGTENLTLSNNPDFIYDENDLSKIKSDFSKFLSDRKVTGGASVYTTGFDTQFEHIIPEYSQALKQELYTPIERRIIAGLGLVEIIEGISSTRKEAILNTKPFFAEINAGIEDFKTLLIDIITTISEKNKSLHRKYFRKNIKIQTPLISTSIDSKILAQLRSGYDRGVISKKTYCETLGLNLDIEIDRREDEEKYEDILFPPVIQNVEKDIEPNQNNKKQDEKIKKNIDKDGIPDDKKSLEKKNFNLSLLEEAKCYHCKEIFDFESQDEIRVGVVACPACGGEIEKSSLIYEEGVIVKKKDGWHVVSKKGKNLGGPYKTKKEAVERLKEIEYWKKAYVKSSDECEKTLLFLIERAINEEKFNVKSNN